MVLSIILGIILYILPGLYTWMFSFTNLLYIITSYSFLLFVDLIVVGILLAVFLYYLIRPIETSNGKIVIAIIEMVLGGIVDVFPIFSIILFSTRFYVFYLDGLLFHLIFGLITYCFLLIPGILLFKHGWEWRKITGSNDIS